MESLAAKRIIRLEPRLGGEFAEITHEFLIPSIRQRITDELNGNNDYANFRWALRTVMRFKDIDFRSGTEYALPRAAFNILHRERERLFLGASPTEKIVPELMLRSALWFGADHETLEHWLNQADKHDFLPTPGEILSPARMGDPSRHLLALWEFAIVNEHALGAGFSPEQSASVLRSQLERATDAERPAVVFWTKKVNGDESQRVSDR